MRPHLPDKVPQAMAAKVLKVTRQAVRYWVDNERVKTYEVRGEIWVSLADCRRWKRSPKKRKRQRPAEAEESNEL